MFDWAKNNSSKNEMGCPEYRLQLEDRVSGDPARPTSDPQLDLHLLECSRCQEALDAALFAGRLTRGAAVRPIEPSERFVVRVMAAIREEEARLSAPNAIWRPIEALASRFAMVAAMVLLALSIYLAEFAPKFDMSITNTQTEIGAGLPEPPAQPANADEVLMSLADRDNGF